MDRRLRHALHELQLAERNAVIWFSEVLERKLFRDLGFSSIYQYAGEALGFSRPRTAQFIRLCESLKELPALKKSVAAGDVSWTKAREVAKVATPETESVWVDLARREGRRKLESHVRMAQARGRARRRNGGRQLGLADGARPRGLTVDVRQRDLTEHARREELTDGARPGELVGGVRGEELTDGAWPGGGHSGDLNPPDVDLSEVPVTLSMRFTPEQYARYEALLEKLRKCGERAAREELILAGLEALLAGTGSTTADAASPGRAEVSPMRGVVGSATGAAAGSQRGAAAPTSGAQASSTNAAAGAPARTPVVSPRSAKGGRQLPVYQIIVQQCEECGCAHVETSRGPKAISPAVVEAMRCDARVHRAGERNRATIPPAVRREVMARDKHRCRAPGCGSARFLEVHHIVPRAEGGSNRPHNLVTLCSACHRIMHALPPHERRLPQPLRE